MSVQRALQKLRSRAPLTKVLHVITFLCLRELLTVDEPGGLKRSGGQGDILSGTLTTFLAWARIFAQGEAQHAGAPSPDTLDHKRLVILAAYGASTLTRNVSREVFKQKGRALLADDLLPEVGPGFERLFGGDSGSGAQL